MSPKAIDSKQCRVDLESPLGGLLIVHSLPHRRGLYLHSSPNHANNRNASALGGRYCRCSCGGRNGRGSDGVSTALLCLRENVGFVCSVGVEDGDGFCGAPPWIADSEGREKRVGVHYQIPVLDEGGGGSGGDVFVGEVSAEDGDACGACSGGCSAGCLRNCRR